MYALQAYFLWTPPKRRFDKWRGPGDEVERKSPRYFPSNMASISGVDAYVSDVTITDHLTWFSF